MHIGSFRPKIFSCFILILLLGTGLGASSADELNGRQNDSGAQGLTKHGRAVSVADLIRMNEVFNNNGHLSGPYDEPRVAEFSPDEKKFVIVVERGDLETNTTVYSLTLFRTRDIQKSPTPTVLTSFASSSNRPGIEQVRWQDNRTVTFLAENPGEQHQLYTIDCDTRHLRRLTNYPTSLAAYAISVDGQKVFFSTTLPGADPTFEDKVRRQGLVVTTQSLWDLLGPQNKASTETFNFALFRTDLKSNQVARVPTKNQMTLPWIWPSPDGKYVIVPVSTVQFFDKWKDYEDPQLQMWMLGKHAEGESSTVFQFELIDLTSGTAQPLIDAPLEDVGESDPIWSHDGTSVLVFQTYLPLDPTKPTEYDLRKRAQFIAQVKIPSREVIPISDEPLRFVRWDHDTVIFKTNAIQKAETVAHQQTPVGWRELYRRGGRWVEADRPDITLDEDRNTPPKIVLTDPATGSKSTLLDLNPQFAEVAFGRVEPIVFDGTDGHKVNGELYLPPDIDRGKRYPLVIQTHGWQPLAANKFRPDGPYPGVFAAQALVDKGVVVLQVEEYRESQGTPTEIHAEVTAYEGSIDYLDHLGLIDRNRVGIMGFSRTGLGVKYALTHSEYRFAAATLADSTDHSYFTYLAILNSLPSFGADAEGTNGRPPFGEGLASWLKNAAGFNLYRVKTPVRLEAHSRGSLLGEWEWFASLWRLGKPVELLLIPDATHVPVKPWERMVSQQGDVDWFCFWLKGEEDPDAAKAEQYARWRELRKLQEENEKKAKTAATPRTN